MENEINAKKPKSNAAGELKGSGPLAAVAVLAAACCLGLPILLGVLSGGGIALFGTNGWGFWGAAAAGLITALGVAYAVHKLRCRSGASDGRGSE